MGEGDWKGDVQSYYLNERQLVMAGDRLEKMVLVVVSQVKSCFKNYICVLSWQLENAQRSLKLAGFLVNTGVHMGIENSKWNMCILKIPIKSAKWHENQ